jgi:hypothetical protein
MTTRTGYQLNVDTLETFEDVKVILDGLNLTTYPDGDDWEVLQKYFTTEIEIPQLPDSEDLKLQLETQDYGE